MKKVSDEAVSREVRLSLDEIVHDGAQKMLGQALELEVEAFLNRHRHVVDDEGRRQIVRNGHSPKREILTGAGRVEVRQPRVRDRREIPQENKLRFSSAVLPPYLRRSKSIDELIPWLYLRGISSGDFAEALKAIAGPDAKGLSPNVVTRLSESWRQEHEAWSRRDLSDHQYVYFWADGIHFNIRLEEERQCILVLMGATADGRKELIGVLDGYRESEQSWRELLLDLKSRGLKEEPKIAVGDGADTLRRPHEFSHSLITISEWTGIRDVARREIDNTGQLIELLESTDGVLLHVAAKREEEDIRILGSDLSDQLRKKIKIMVAQREDYERLFMKE